jgi:hypothetical protein
MCHCVSSYNLSTLYLVELELMKRYMYVRTTSAPCVLCLPERQPPGRCPNHVAATGTFGLGLLPAIRTTLVMDPLTIWYQTQSLWCSGPTPPPPPLLMVNFHQPSHEFTFSVGIDLISKLMILTLMIYQVRTRMWFLEFIVYTGIKYLNEDFWVKFIKHFERRSWSPTQVKTRGEHDSKWSKD